MGCAAELQRVIAAPDVWSAALLSAVRDVTWELLIDLEGVCQGRCCAGFYNIGSGHVYFNLGAHAIRCEIAPACCRSLGTDDVGKLLHAMVAAEPPVNFTWTSAFQDTCRVVMSDVAKVLTQLPLLCSLHYF